METDQTFGQCDGVYEQKEQMMIKRVFDKLKRYFFNVHFLLCFGLAWFITNGWAYILLTLAYFLDNRIMFVISSSYLAFLWFPFTPEKIITLAISVFLLKMLFPKDEATLELFEDIKKKFVKNKR